MWDSIREIFILLLKGTSPLQRTIITIFLLTCLTIFGIFYMQKTNKAIASEVPENVIVKKGGQVNSIEKTKGK